MQIEMGRYVEDFDPTIEETYRKRISLGENTILYLMDDFTNGESFMQEFFIKNHEAFILMYSITDKSSFEEIEKIYQLILRIKDVDHFPNLIIVGNKIDLEDERQVTKSKGEQLAKKFGV